MDQGPARDLRELDRGERLIIICHQAGRSTGVAVWLRNRRFENAKPLHGGIDAWSSAVDTTAYQSFSARTIQICTIQEYSRGIHEP
jgi:rhodanese-related sulfurtransferase